MFNFAYPTLLYLLLLAPALYGLFYLARLARRKKLRKYGNISVLKPLMPHASPYKPYIKITLELIALVALVFALARPRAGEKEAQEDTQGIEVMIAFDVSRSMLASSNDDPAGISRINRAKYILDRIVDKLDNDKVGLIVFAGEAYTQLPMTTDFVSAKMYINSLSTDMIQSQGTAIGEAISLAMRGFTSDETIGKAIILITDAEDHEGNAVEMAQAAAKRNIQIDVVGIGSTNGNPIPLDNRGTYLKDIEGNVVTTALNADAATEIAHATDGIFINGASGSAISDLTESLDRLEKGDLKHVTYKASAEQFPVFGWIALIFLIVDIFILDREIGWLTKFNFFTKTESKK
ncbi:MAG: VWA domain-containing protein [Muribaculaceae bacterium]|nr:VWA domain-containing protein [Muribaculaceae bacterium]MDE5857449.1 VWA domain-containing protein [Muribaculaceae bacterium]